MSVTNQLTLFMPDLLTVTHGQRLPALGTLLGKADTIPAQQDLYALFNLPNIEQPAVAAFTALGDGLTVQSNEWWLRADPAEMQADQSTVYLIGTDHFGLAQAEADQIIAELNQFLQQDGLELLAPHPLRWYLKLTTEPGLITIAPEQLVGKPIKFYLSTGEKQAYWRRLFSELQILLANLPINQQRQAQGKPIVNGLWFWGEGKLPVQTPVVSWNKVWTDSPLCKGLAYWQQLVTTKIPTGFNECLLQMAPEGDYLLLLPSITVNNILEWEQDWFKPMLSVLKSKQLGELTIITQQQCFTVKRKQLRKWWRREYRF